MNTYDEIPNRLTNLADQFNGERHFSPREANAIRNYLLSEADKVQAVLNLANKATSVPHCGNIN